MSGANSGPAPPNATSAKSRGSRPLPDAVELDRVDHVGGRDADDSGSRLVEREPERRRDLLLDRLRRKRAGDLIRPPRKEDSSGARGRAARRSPWAPSRPPVTRRPGLGSGRSGPDLQHPTTIEIGDRPAARADRGHVDHRQAQVEARRSGSRASACGGPAPVNDTDISGGPTDIERDQVLEPGGLPAVSRRRRHRRRDRIAACSRACAKRSPRLDAAARMS